jgi:hypothetical protein
MSLIFMILSVPFMSMAGYHPHVVVNGHCIAEPGSYQALWCPAPVKHKR